MAHASDPAKISSFYLVLGLCTPTLITWVYFVLMADAKPVAQQLAYGLGKLLQTGLLTVAALVWLRSYLRTSLFDAKRLSISDWLLGLGSGLLIGCVIVVAYHYLLSPMGVMQSVQVEVSKKLEAFGGKSPFLLISIGLFYSLLHSGFEELYWRGFVHQGLSCRLSFWSAAAISSLGFMAHHVLVLAKFFGYDSVWTYLASLGVAIGGLVWAWMAIRTNSLLPGWLSHGIVDASIFLVGYHLVFVTAAAK